MKPSEDGVSRPRATPGSVCALVLLAGAAVALQGCALYGELLQHGGSLPLGEGGAAWSPAVSTPGGAAFGVQVIQRF